MAPHRRASICWIAPRTSIFLRITELNDDTNTSPQGRLSPEAERALAEAAERRKKETQTPTGPREINGRDGPEPARFGDWEAKGRAVDF